MITHRPGFASVEFIGVFVLDTRFSNRLGARIGGHDGGVHAIGGAYTGNAPTWSLHCQTRSPDPGAAALTDTL